MNREQIEHEIELDDQAIKVATKRRGLNLRELDHLDRRETEQFSKLQKRGKNN